MRTVGRSMSLAQWSLFVGTLLVTMVLAGTLLGRLPLSSAMVRLGFSLAGKGGLNDGTAYPFVMLGLGRAAA